MGSGKSHGRGEPQITAEDFYSAELAMGGVIAMVFTVIMCCLGVPMVITAGVFIGIHDVGEYMYRVGITIMVFAVLLTVGGMVLIVLMCTGVIKREKHYVPSTTVYLSENEQVSGPQMQPPQQMGYQTPQQMGRQPPQQMGHQTPQQMGHQPPQQMGYQTPQQTSRHPTQQMGYQNPKQTGYQPSPRMGYQPSPHPGYESSPRVGYQPSPHPGYQPSPRVGYQPSPQTGYRAQPHSECPPYQPAPSGYGSPPPSYYHPTAGHSGNHPQQGYPPYPDQHRERELPTAPQKY